MRTPEELRMAALIRQRDEATKIIKPSKFEIVTKEIADEWLLDTETINEKVDNIFFKQRKVRPYRVERLGRQMVHGTWIPLPQGIVLTKIAGYNIILDGQHRCQGVVKTGLANVFCVWRDFPRFLTGLSGDEVNVLEALDRVEPRTVADGLRIAHNLDDAKEWTSHLNGIVEFVVGKTPPAEVPELKQVYDIYFKNSTAIWNIDSKACKRATKLWSVLTLYHQANPKGAIELATQVLRKEGMMKIGMPGHTLNRYLETEGTNRSRKGGSNTSYMDMIATACFAHNEGLELTQIRQSAKARPWLREGQGSKGRVIQSKFDRIEFTNTPIGAAAQSA